jgi:hypothetical protein
MSGDLHMDTTHSTHRLGCLYQELLDIPVVCSPSWLKLLPHLERQQLTPDLICRGSWLLAAHVCRLYCGCQLGPHLGSTWDTAELQT